jgi:hypothetical protein
MHAHPPCPCWLPLSPLRTDHHRSPSRGGRLFLCAEHRDISLIYFPLQSRTTFHDTSSFLISILYDPSSIAIDTDQTRSTPTLPLSLLSTAPPPPPRRDDGSVRPPKHGVPSTLLAPPRPPRCRAGAHRRFPRAHGQRRPALHLHPHACAAGEFSCPLSHSPHNCVTARSMEIHSRAASSRLWCPGLDPLSASYRIPPG